MPAEILRRTKGSEHLASESLRLEILNALTNKFKTHSINLWKRRMPQLSMAGRIRIKEASVDWHQVINLAHEINRYAYEPIPSR